MKATLNGHVIADSDDVVTCRDYPYFPAASTRTEWLQKTPRTERDLQCPHGVQFYDVVINATRAPRAAWQYEWPRPEMAQTAGRFGFWQDVTVS